MKKWIFALCAFSFVFLISPVFADTAQDEKNAQTTIENWFAAMKENQVDKASTFLAPQFVSIHTDGIVRNKNQEITLMKHLNMKNFTLSNFKFSHSGDVIIVTYIDKTSEQIDNKKIGKSPAGRMAVLQRQGDKWLIIGYANLDKIA